MIRVKICGITRTEDALAAAKLGAWAVGLIFYKNSPRHIGAYKARKIVQELPPFVTPVGVFVDHKEGAVMDIADFCGITHLQFHGDESPAYCRRFKKYKVIKAFRVGHGFDPAVLKTYTTDAFLFDTHQDGQKGGTGTAFDWSLIKGVKNFGRPVILSGGLTPENVAAAIEEVRPYAVDVNSGVETAPGQKSEAALRNLFAQVYP